MRIDPALRPVLAAFALALAPAVRADDAPVVTNRLTHAELQAVNPDGTSTETWINRYPFTIRGILLNDPADMLSPDYLEGATGRGAGAQYQVFVQSVEPGDRGGTALFMSEGGIGRSYTEAEWAAEYARVTTDPETGRPFRPGDYVEVTARCALYRNGKANINEGHRPDDPNKDFDVRLLTADAGFPQAEAVLLSDLVDLAEDGTQKQIFDSSREKGGEHWQGMRVRLDAIRLTNSPAGWNPDLPWNERLVNCTDAAGRVFPLRLPRYSLGPAPNRWFSATGILNQEGSDTAGYELFVQEIGPVLDIAIPPADPESPDAPPSAVITYSADYSGYQLQVSDDSGTTWQSPSLAFPTVIVIHDPEASPSRLYRLVLPAPAD